MERSSPDWPRNRTSPRSAFQLESTSTISAFCGVRSHSGTISEEDKADRNSGSPVTLPCLSTTAVNALLGSHA
jgi:hypothetical protein